MGQSTLAQEEWTLSPDEIAILEAEFLSSDDGKDSILQSPVRELYVQSCQQSSVECDSQILEQLNHGSSGVEFARSSEQVLFDFSPLPFAEDGFDPTIDNVSVSPTTLNVDAGNQTVTINYTVSDTGGSGLNFLRFYLAKTGAADLSGTGYVYFNGAQTGSGSYTISVPDTVAAGQYTLEAVLSDEAGNFGFNRDPVPGAPSVTILNSNEDVTAPDFVSLSTSTPTVNLDNGQTSAEFSYSVADDGTSGLNRLQLWLRKSGSPDITGPNVYFNGAPTASGNYSLAIPSTASPGSYSIVAILDDEAGNRGYFLDPAPITPSTIEIINGAADETPPSLDSLSVTPQSVDVESGPQQFSFQYSVSDAGSGLDFMRIDLRNSSATITGSILQLSGNSASGTYVFNVPDTSIAGTYVPRLFLFDEAGNARPLNDPTPVSEVTVRNGRPQFNVTSTSSGTITGSFDVRVESSRPVTGFDQSDISLVNIASSAWNCTSSTSQPAVCTGSLAPANDGEVRVFVPEGVAQDVAGATNEASNILTLQYDGSHPTVALSSTASEPVSGAFPLTVTFSEDVTGFELSDLTVGNGVASGLSGSGAVYTATITPSGDGAVTVDVAADVATDAAGNGNTAATQFSLTNDGTAPGVSIATSVSEPVSGSFPITVTFTEDVTGFELSDLTVGNGTASELAGSGAVYTATITPAGDGAVTVDITADVAEDAAGNGNTAATQFSIESDGSAPGVTLATTASEPVSGAFEVSLTFTETVTGLELSDLSVTNGTASNLAGSGASYTVSITPSSDGDVSVSLPAGSAQDEAGNDSTVSNTLSIEADLTAPSVALSSTATEPVSGAFPLTVTFSEDVTGFELSDLTVGNGVASGLAGSGAVYTVTITPSGDGAVTVDVAADVATDAAGNGNTAATQFSIENDIDPPEVQMTSNTATVTGPFNVEITFNKPIAGFEQSDLVVFNGTVTGFVATNDRSFELEITPDTVGTVTVRIPSGAAVDALGQGNAEAELSVEAIIPTSEVSITVSQSTTDVTGILGTAQISNPGGQSLPFEASTNVDWLAVEPSSGQIPALESLEFTFRLTEAAESLEPGTYNAVVTIRRLGANALAASSIATAAGAANPTLAEVPIVLQVEARTGTLRLIARTPSGVSGDAEFTYSSSNSLIDGLVLSTSGGSANSADLELTFGQYSIAQASPVGWRVESISCSGDTDNGSVVDVEAASLIADVDAGESLVCTIVNVRDEDLVRAATQRVINNFLVRRSENILNAMPDLSRRFDVRSQGTGGQFQANAQQGAQNASLSMNFAQEGESDKPLDWSAWVSAEFAGVEDEQFGDSSSDFAILHAGLDWTIQPDLILGVMGQYDWMDETQREIAAEAGGIRNPTINGAGWMVGPYVVWRPSESLILDGLAMAGQSSNDVNPLGWYEDSFDTERYLFDAGITGIYDFGNWSLRPNASLAYLQDTQSTYTDSLGFVIPEQDVTLGRLTFGPELSYFIPSSGTTKWLVGGSLDGVWAFEQTALLTSGGNAYERDELTANLGVFLGVEIHPGAVLRFEANSYGLGNEGYSAEALRIELVKTLGRP